MNKYIPPIEERETVELMEIYLSPPGDWQDEIVRLATEELYRRGLTSDELKGISTNYRKEQEEAHRKYQLQLEENAKESYSILEMVSIFFGAPLIFNPRYRSFGSKTVSELKQENYQIKYKQRLYLLIGGALFWIILFYLALN